MLFIGFVLLFSLLDKGGRQKFQGGVKSQRLGFKANREERRKREKKGLRKRQQGG
jgi:hypothetical protein